MFNVILVDDCDARREEIQSALDAVLTGQGRCDAVGSSIEAKELLTSYYDILIIDINIPTRPAGDPSDAASLDLLYEIAERGTLVKPGAIIGITAFDGSYLAAEKQFSYYLQSLVRWLPASQAGLDSILNFVRYCQESKSGCGAGYDYDLCILTALSEEAGYVDELDWNWSSSTPLDHSLFYREGFFFSEGAKFRVVHASASRMGLVHCAIRAARLISAFKPRFLAMCGVCGGFEANGIELGDLIVADHVWELLGGKYKTGGGLLPSPEPFQRCVPTWLSESMRDFIDDIDLGAFEGRASIRMGPMVSSSAVVADERIVREIIEHRNRKTLGIEMEIFSLYSAALDAGFPRPTPMAVKGVSDLADVDKSDGYREVPARNSARFLQLFFEKKMFSIAKHAGAA